MALYLLVSDNVISNIIECEDDATAFELGAVPYYEEADIGAPYTPPLPRPSDSERIEILETENALLKAQLQAQTERSDFIEDCIAEMATQVYAQ